MPNLIRCCLLFALLLISTSDAAPLRAGAAAIDISPTKLPVIVNGSFLERRVSTIADRLHARSIVLHDGADTISITLVDSCMVPRDLCDAAKTLAHEQTGIPIDRMLIASTHTHSAPSAMRALGTPVDPDYIKWLPGKIAESIAAAHKRLAPAELGFGVVDQPNHVACRRWIYHPNAMLTDPFGEKTVRANMHPGPQNPNATGPTGPEDPQLSILSLRHADGRPMALLGNFGMHYYAGNAGISADYFGVFADFVGGELAADESFVGIMSNGTSGDIWRRDYSKPKDHPQPTITEYARELAQAAATLAKQLDYQRELDLEMREVLLPLDRRLPDEQRIVWAKKLTAAMGERSPKSRPEVYAREVFWLQGNPRAELKLQVLRLGDYWINAIPCETYALTGLKLKTPDQDTMNISLANGGEGYIPPKEQYVLGGYNTWPARSAGLEEGAEQAITETLLDARSSLKPFDASKWKAPRGVDSPYRVEVSIRDPLVHFPLDEWVPNSSKYFRVDARLHYEPGVVFYLPGIPNDHDNSRAPTFAGGRVKIEPLSLDDTYSVSFWMHNALPNTKRPITGYVFSRGLDGDDAANGDHLGIMGTHQKEHAGRLLFFNGNEQNEFIIGRTKLEPKTWHHVTLVRKGAEVRVYLDGLPEFSGEVSATRPNDAQLFLGGRCDNFANFEGKIDEVTFWNRALTDTEAAGLAQASITEPPLPFPQTPEAFIAQLQMPDNLVIECVAAEPLIEDPISIDFGADGRLWVVEMRDYPDGMNANGAPGGRIKVLSDRDGDGVFDHASVYRDQLYFPTGVKAWGDGAIYCDASGVHFPNGDTMTGFGNNTLHTRVNGPWWTLDNRLMFANGRNSTRIQWREKTYDIFRRDFSIAFEGKDLRTEGGQSQFGRTRDDWDNWFGVDYQTLLYHFPLPDHYLRRNPRVASPASFVYVPEGPRRTPVRPLGAGPLRTPHASEAGRTTSHSGPCINRSDLLGPDYAGDAFVCEPSHTVVLRRKLTPTKSTFVATDPAPNATQEWLASTDNWFRPTQIRSGPDGALWLVDMYRMIIEHTKWLPAEQKKTMNVRAGDAAGRIYRIYPRGKWPAPMPNLKTLDDQSLAKQLESPHGTLRDLVQQEILERKTTEAEGEIRGRSVYSKRPAVRAQALWTLSGLGQILYNDLLRGIKDPDARVRAQAARMMEPHEHPGLKPALIEALRKETNPRAIQQMACSIGQWSNDPVVTTLLETIVAKHPENAFIRAAARSSMPHAGEGIREITWKIEPRDNSHAKRSDLVQAALSTLPAQGNIQRGKAIFEQQCVLCHAVDGQGHPIGPNLAALSNRSDAFLVESILDPQRAIDPDYVALTLLRNDGKSITGVMKDATGNAFHLLAVDGVLHEVNREDVKQITNLNRSLMPETFDQTIPAPQQLRDLLRYLQALK